MTLLAIGAGASALALIAFSGTCWLASSCLGESVVGDITFWEILAVSFGGSAVVLLVRPVAGRRRQSNDDERAMGPDSSRGTSSPRWRQMYDQLSEEDRKAFKAAMKKYCER